MKAKYEENPQRVHPEPSITPLSPPAPIIGRQVELTLVMSHYEAAKEGHAHVVLLVGEPGIGKTRLLDEVALRTAQEGAIVLRGGSSEAEGMPPFLPFLEALGQYIQITPLDHLREQVAAAPQVLASLFPELTFRLGDLPVPSASPPEQARLRLYEAIGAFLEAIGTPHGLVLILDDLQWADSASLDLLCHLARRQPNARLLLLGAYRESEFAHHLALAHTVAELSRQRRLTTVTVGPLSAHEVDILARTRLGAPLSSEASALLYGQSEGNPFFAEELLHGWIETRALAHQRGHWLAMTPLDQALPPTIVGALSQRFARLSPTSIDHLRIAAIIGRTFDLVHLAAIEAKEIEVVEEQLREAVHARLIIDNQIGTLTFSHDKIRECLYAEVSTSRRRRLHGMIGQLLEERYAGAKVLSMQQLAELAFHFARSPDRAKGIEYSHRAAVQALQAFAAEEAMSLYQTALDLLGSEEGPRGNLLLGLGEASLLAGKEAEAVKSYAAGYDALMHEGDLNAAAQAAHGLGRAHWQQEQLLEAQTALENALRLIGECSCASTVRVLVDLSTLLTVYVGLQAQGASYAQRALEMAQALGDTHLEAVAKRTVAANLCMPVGDLSSAMVHLEDALRLAETGDDFLEAAECCLYLATPSYWLADIQRSRELSRRQITYAERCQQSYALRTAYPWLVLLSASQGEWVHAEQMAEQARSIVDQLANPMPLSFLHQMQAFLAYQLEDYETAEHECQAALVHQQSGPGGLMFYVGLLGLMQATRGKRDEATATLLQQEGVLAFLPAGMLPVAPIATCQALGAIALGEHELAGRCYARLFPFQGQLYWFLVDRVLGMLAALRGDWEAAATHFAAAEATARREGLCPELARILQGQAEVELARGDQTSRLRGRDHLNEARALFEELGMLASAQQVRRRLHSLSHSPSPLMAPVLPAHLTQREVEVLKLVAQGKSNRQIAQVLCLTEKTVTNHLTHIFNKTGCENRAASTAFALRHGLA
jgi:DNA-binding CsgD family transcriptional regulator/tetratricopeptide (TPR) repeat protein